jgi:hypothetical protein
MNVNSILVQYASVGDYLFLIMIVLASIIQSIAQNRKKKALEKLTQDQAQQKPGELADIMETRPEKMTGYERPLDNIFDSIERILVPELANEKYIWSEDYSVKQAEVVTPSEPISDFVTTEGKTISSIAEREAERISAEPLVQKNIVSYKSRIRADFSLKKAVIYSEILNKKYI